MITDTILGSDGIKNMEITLIQHETAECPQCSEPLYYGEKDEASGWKVYYECVECGWEQMAGWVKMSEVDHADEVDEKARSLGDRWS